MRSGVRLQFHSPALVVVVVLMPLWIACASAERASGGLSRSAIGQDEVAELAVANAYEVVETLRPQWLRPRGDLSITSPEQRYPLVYMNGMRLGRLEVLCDIHVADVRRIEWIAPRDATTRFGTGHAGGIIRVITRPNGR